MSFVFASFTFRIHWNSSLIRPPQYAYVYLFSQAFSWARLIHPSNTKKMASSISKRNQNNVSEQDISQQTSDDADYISSMPQEVLLKILYFLPLKYWTILSAVSSKWKNLWTYISIINLDELEMIVKIIKGDVCRHLIDEFPSSSSYAYQRLQRLVHAARRKFADFVDRLILFHSGCAIDNFRLSFRYVAQDEYASRVDKWVHFAMTSNTKRIELNFSEAINYHRREGWQVNQTNFAQPYTLRPYSFVSRILETLILNYCKFEAFSFGQFVSLRRLCLICAEVLDRSIGDLVSKCPALEDLTLESCFIPDKFFVCGQELNIESLFLINCMTRNWVMFPINIATPELLSLTIVGTYLMSSSINKATKLVDVTIDIQQGIVNPTQGNFLASLLISLNHCQDLTLSSWCIQVLFCYCLWYIIHDHRTIMFLSQVFLVCCEGFTYSRQSVRAIAKITQECEVLKVDDVFNGTRTTWSSLRIKKLPKFRAFDHGYWCEYECWLGGHY